MPAAGMHNTPKDLQLLSSEGVGLAGARRCNRIAALAGGGAAISKSSRQRILEKTTRGRRVVACPSWCGSRQVIGRSVAVDAGRSSSGRIDMFRKGGVSPRLPRMPSPVPADRREDQRQNCAGRDQQQGRTDRALHEDHRIAL